MVKSPISNPHESRRRVLALLTLPWLNAIYACVNRRIEKPSTNQNLNIPEPLQWITDLEGKEVLGGDEILLEWKPNSLEVELSYSLGNGQSWEKITQTFNSSFLWVVPQITERNVLLKIEKSNDNQMAISSHFKIKECVVINPNDHSELESVKKSKIFDSTLYGPFLLKKLDTEYVCISLLCTHSGCTTTFNGEYFNCSCHGSKFDQEGRVLNGPAERQLDLLKVKQVAAHKVLVYG